MDGMDGMNMDGLKGGFVAREIGGKEGEKLAGRQGGCLPRRRYTGTGAVFRRATGEELAAHPSSKSAVSVSQERMCTVRGAECPRGTLGWRCTKLREG